MAKNILPVECATPLLWAHQLKREHLHLLQRVEVLESMSFSTDAAANTVTRAHAAPTSTHSQDTAADDEELVVVPRTMVDMLRARISALEENTKASAEESPAESLISGLETRLLAAITTVEQSVQTLKQENTATCENLRGSFDVMQGRADSLHERVESLNNKMVQYDSAAKSINTAQRTLEYRLADLEERVWTVENSIANVESGRREDRERVGSVATRLTTQQNDVATAKEKTEWVVKVAEVLVDRDYEVRGRVAELEARMLHRDGTNQPVQNATGALEQESVSGIEVAGSHTLSEANERLTTASDRNESLERHNQSLVSASRLPPQTSAVLSTIRNLLRQEEKPISTGLVTPNVPAALPQTPPPQPVTSKKKSPGKRKRQKSAAQPPITSCSTTAQTPRASKRKRYPEPAENISPPHTRSKTRAAAIAAATQATEGLVAEPRTPSHNIENTNYANTQPSPSATAVPNPTKANATITLPMKKSQPAIAYGSSSIDTRVAEAIKRVNAPEDITTFLPAAPAKSKSKVKSKAKPKTRLQAKKQIEIQTMNQQNETETQWKPPSPSQPTYVSPLLSPAASALSTEGL